VRIPEQKSAVFTPGGHISAIRSTAKRSEINGCRRPGAVTHQRHQSKAMGIAKLFALSEYFTF
jgi:hypothetical protein